VSATTAVYSRDLLLSPVLRELENLLQAVRSGMFHPDRSRSGMVTPAAMAVVPGTPFAVPPMPGPQTPTFLGATLPVGGDAKFVHEASLEALEFGETEHETLSEVDVQQSGLERQSEVGEPSPDSETTEDDSVQGTSDSSADEIEDSRREFLEPSTKFFMNEKSLVILCERTEGVLKCGRRVSPHYVVLYELHGIRCSRCFDI
jgi:hypothetical protein